MSGERADRRRSVLGTRIGAEVSSAISGTLRACRVITMNGWFSRSR